MTPDQGFMAASAPAERVAFSTKRKAMDLPSGDQASESMLPVRWVSWRVLPVDLDQRKTCSCPAFSDLAVQVEVKASVGAVRRPERGTHWQQSPGLSESTLRTVSLDGSVTLVR